MGATDSAAASGHGAPLDQDRCASLLGVSRETLASCAALLQLLLRWQTAYNLVGRSTLHDPWRRHILDSAQLLHYVAPDARTVVDLGTGAGFPGLVLALVGDLQVHLIESSGAKVQFLREAVRRTGASATIHHARIEALAPLPADVVTSRALAPLPALLDLAAPFLAPGGQCLFLSSRQQSDELTRVSDTWHMVARTFDSLSDRRGVVLQLKEVFRAPDRQP